MFFQTFHPLSFAYSSTLSSGTYRYPSVLALVPSKALLPTDGTDVAKQCISDKLVQLQKQYSPNDVTDDGISILVNEVQRAKQKSPNEVTDDGISILVNEVQPLKQ